MNSSTEKAESDSQVLCYLCDWKTRSSEGVCSKGETIIYRYGITVSNYAWSLTEFRKDSIPSKIAHASRLHDLIPSFKKEAGLDPLDCILACAGALENISKLNMPLKVKETGTKVEKALFLALQVDTIYKTNFAVDDGVRKRFFGSDEEGEE
jgi:hypothetical protein